MMILRWLVRFIKRLLIVTCIVLGIISFGYTWLVTTYLGETGVIDSGLSYYLPQSAPGSSARELATGSPYIPGRDHLEISDFSDVAQGKSYLDWKKQFGNPFDFLLKGTSIDKSLVELLLNSSSSKEDLARAVSGISEKDLAYLGQNARELKKLAGKQKLPDNLPDSVKDMLKTAQSSTEELAVRAENLSASGLRAKQGDFSVLTRLNGDIEGFQHAARDLDSRLTRVEEDLGAKN